MDIFDGHRFTIITTDPNSLVLETTHDRMPALATEPEAMLWMDRSYKTADVRDLLRTADEDYLARKEVATMGEI